MDIKAILFDVNGTLVDILTEDDRIDIFRAIGHYLTYQGIELRRNEVRDFYFQAQKEQLSASNEQYAEFDAVKIWKKIIDEHSGEYTKTLPAEAIDQIPLFIAQMYRGISRHRLCPYPHVVEVLDVLRKRYKLAIVSDAQSAYARGELHKAGILEYFDPVIISGDFGYRKPDIRLFQKALDHLQIQAAEAIYIGNDMFHDIYGAQQAGMKAVMYNSDQGTKVYKDTKPDFTISDYRELLKIVEPTT